MVSIRTRPFGRVMRERRRSAARGRCVSIRTRPFGRVMLVSSSVFAVTGKVSIRTRPFGRVMHGGWRDYVDVPLGVSIRTRPFGRVMRRPNGTLPITASFQSAPGLSAG